MKASLTNAQIAALIPAALLAGVTLGGLDPLHADSFRSFYAAAVHLRGASYELPTEIAANLNPPTFSVLLLPLTWLPYVTAFWLWMVTSALALAGSLRLIAREARPSTSAWIWTGLLLIGSMPSLFAWQQGQVTWVLLYLVTRAWVSSSARAAGAWLGLAIAIKPPLALLAICLAPAVVLWSGAVSFGLTVAVIAATGWQPWQEWLALSGVVRWLILPTNLSLFGIAARVQWTGSYAPTVSELSGGALLVIGAAAALGYWSLRRTQGDSRWTLALLWSLALSPAGWIYYLPLGLGPMLRGWPSRSALATAAVLCWCVPTFLLAQFVDTHRGATVAGLVYPIGLLLAWAAWSAPQTTSAPVTKPAVVPT
jgi:hypothetical protein